MPTSRRDFLRVSSVATVSAAGAMALSSCVSEPQVQEPEVFSGTPTPALPTSDLEPGRAAFTYVSGQAFLLFRESADTVHAFDAVCPHQGCTVGVIEQSTLDLFSCPCHSSRFDLKTGQVMGGPAPHGLIRHRAHISDDWIHIEV